MRRSGTTLYIGQTVGPFLPKIVQGPESRIRRISDHTTDPLQSIAIHCVASTYITYVLLYLAHSCNDVARARH